VAIKAVLFRIRASYEGKKPPKITNIIIITTAGTMPAKNMLLIGTRAKIANIIKGTEGAKRTPRALALVTNPMPLI
jgi:hypothetical protein